MHLGSGDASKGGEGAIGGASFALVATDPLFVETGVAIMMTTTPASRVGDVIDLGFSNLGPPTPAPEEVATSAPGESAHIETAAP